MKKASKTRHGVAEAEDRLITLFFPLFVATSGLLIFGFCAQNPGTNRWIGLQFGFGMLSFGLMQVPSVGFNYVSCQADYKNTRTNTLSLLIPTTRWQRTASLW